MMIFLVIILRLWTSSHIWYKFASRTSGHSLRPEIKSGVWRAQLTAREKYEEYLPSGEISKYLEDDMLVEFRVPRTPFPMRSLRKGDIQQLVLMEGMELQAQHQLRKLFQNQLKYQQAWHQPR